ncbi:MAG TPA: LLM class flavin-dependent oxidoreductase [Candidatus Limnocylindria bacterium]|nr:LLM class flavin-dependent oxidoreductase [Candidatus Limnocylindria bacterium]
MSVETVAPVPRPLDRTERGMTYGVLVPHFGAHATPARIIAGSRMAEQIGFEAVWVRDHLLWKPHGMEGTNRTFVEPLASLNAIGAVTERIQLGTAVLIPLRWPLKLAQDLAAMSFLHGPRVIAGLGMGSNHAELAAAGFNREQRKLIFTEMAQIVRRAWAEDEVTFRGQFFSFEAVTLEPKPAAPIPIWYGGTTRASVRTTIALCDAWMPGRIPLATLDDRLALLAELEAESGRRITRSVIPLVKVDTDRARARADLDIEALAGSSEASKTWIAPPGGFRTIEDIRGIAVVGEPDEVVEQIVEIAERGIDHFVFDLRMQFDRYEEVLHLIAERVLPALRAARV